MPLVSRNSSTGSVQAVWKPGYGVKWTEFGGCNHGPQLSLIRVNQGGELFCWGEFQAKMNGGDGGSEWHGEYPGRQGQKWPCLWSDNKWYPHPSFSTLSPNLTLNWVSDGKVLSRLSGELKQILFTSSYFSDDQTNHFICLADNLALFPSLKIKSRKFCEDG